MRCSNCQNIDSRNKHNGLIINNEEKQRQWFICFNCLPKIIFQHLEENKQYYTCGLCGFASNCPTQFNEDMCKLCARKPDVNQVTSNQKVPE